MKLKLCLFLAVLAVLRAAAYAAVPEGSPAPQVSMKLLKDGAVSDFPGWGAYRGKVVVVELWGTWCEGCVVAIPHLNSLQEEFRGKPVEFFSITDESAAEIGKFMKKHPMSVSVAVEGKDALRALGTGRFPQTVIISTAGTVLLYTQPAELSVKGLARLLDTGSVSGINRVVLEKTAEKKTGDQSLFDLRIDSAPCDGNSRSGRGANSSYVTLDFTGGLRSAISYVYGISRTNVAISAGLPEQCFAFRVRVPRTSENGGKALLKQALSVAYRAEVRAVKKEKPVLLLRYDGAAPHAGLVAAARGGSTGGRNGLWNAAGAEISALAGMLEGLLDIPVVDETGLTGNYDMNVEWTPGDRASLDAALKEKFGMTLVPGNRSVETLEAYPAGDSAGL